MSVLELASVSKTFRDATETVRAVDDVSLSISSGEIVALYGPSGSGKSTLLLLATGLEKPDRGVVRLQGEDLAGLSASARADRLRERVGVVYQQPQLFPGTPAITNAAMKLLGGGVPVAQANREALPWLIRLGLEHRLQHPPEKLSGGERQRVAVARALTGNPVLLLLDEPTGSLDSSRGAQILEVVKESAGHGAGVLIVTHDPSVARIAHRVCAMRDGKLSDMPRELAATA